MTETIPAIRTVVVERQFAHPPEKLWRALTQPQLIADWLMQSDFAPVEGHKFRFTADWGGVDCEVTEVEPITVLAYRWAAMGLDSVVTWTLTPRDGGTWLRLEQEGFKPDQEYAYQGARNAWPAYFTAIEIVVAKLD